MTNKLLEIALMLTAVDNMSAVTSTACNNAMSAMQKLKDYSVREFTNGLMMVEAGKQIAETLNKPIDKFAQMQAAQIDLKNSMLKPGGVLDVQLYNKMATAATALSDKYTGSTADYLKMMEILKSNRIDEADILGGTAEAASQLGVLFKIPPGASAEFLAHMKNDFAIPASKMYEAADLAQRAFYAGLGKGDGAAAVNDMNQFFSKTAIGARNLGLEGIQASKDLAVLGNIFMTKGIESGTAGTNMRRILDQIASPKALEKMQEAAQKYGVGKLNFFDAKGGFMGIPNMIAELDKLRNLSPGAVSEILDSFGGKQGLSVDFLKLLTREGVEQFNSMGDRFFSNTKGQADLATKVKQQMTGLEYWKEVNASSWVNTWAKIGEVAAGPMTRLYTMLNGLAVKLRDFVSAHPLLTKMIMGFLALTSAALIVAGTFKIVRGAMGLIDVVFGLTKALRWLRIAWALQSFAIMTALRSLGAFIVRAAVAGASGFVSLLTSLWGVITATWAWTAALLANPITWIVLGVIALGVAVYMLIKHWDAVTAFFRRLWDNVKRIFWQAVQFVWKNVLPWFMPQVLIFQHWDKIKAWFIHLWDKVKDIFNKAVAWLLGIGPRMYEAGKNIVLNIWNGIKSMAHKPIEAIKEMAHKIRNLLPFSPAKDGPLRDIHKIRLVETIAESIKPNALIDRMRSVATQIFELRPQQANYQPLGLQAIGAGTNITIHYAPVYHAAPGEAPGESPAMTKFFQQNKRELMRMIMDEINNNRRSY